MMRMINQEHYFPQSMQGLPSTTRFHLGFRRSEWNEFSETINQWISVLTEASQNEILESSIELMEAKY